MDQLPAMVSLQPCCDQRRPMASLQPCSRAFGLGGCWRKHRSWQRGDGGGPRPGTSTSKAPAPRVLLSWHRLPVVRPIHLQQKENAGAVSCFLCKF
eukprot:2118806-Rhodomonas_salina.1